MDKNRFADVYGIFTISAADNTGYSLVFYGGSIAVVNTFGSVLAEFDADDIPVVDVAPVVHGRDAASCPSLFECSVCGWYDSDTLTGDTSTYNYCPYCGAKMDLQEAPDINAEDNADHCVCCGEIIPEGRQICPKCEKFADF